MKRRKQSSRKGVRTEGGNFLSLRATRIVGCLVAIALFFLVEGCGGGSPPSTPSPKGPTPVVGKAKAEPAKDAAKMDAEKKEEAEYAYNPAGKPDPFKPFIQLSPVKESLRSALLTPLQRYEISQLKLVAIISTPQGNVALVEDSAGKGYFLKKGTDIGKNDGKVTKILKDRVIIEELFQDVLGQTKKNEVELVLHRLEEGEKP